MNSGVKRQGNGRRRAIPFLILAVLTIASALTAWSSSRPSGAVAGPEGVAIYDVANLAPANTTRSGETVKGIACQKQANEIVKYHIHIHVGIFVDGKRLRLPAGIGVTEPALVERYSTGSFYDVGLYDCMYWIHTHVADGIVHVEAPVKQAFTLGQLFAIWNQPLGPNRVGPATGHVVVFENAKRLSGDPGATPLLPHGNIQIDVGSPVVPYASFGFNVTGGCGEGTSSCSGAQG